MKKLLALLAAGSLIAGCGVSSPNLSNDNASRFGAKRVLSEGAKKWTIMVHLAADNNLYNFGLEDMNEMEAGINPDDTNVIVLFDGTSEGDSAVYEIQKDPAGKNTKLVSVANSSAPFIPANHEIDSGDVNVVKAFGEWAIKQYPAEHYAVAFWDHGSGIFRKGAYQPTSFLSKGFGWDDNGGHMNTRDLSTLIPAFAKTAGVPIDMVGFDACLMGHVEIGYQMKDYARFLVASEELEPGAGWDYMGWLKGITKASTPVMVANGLVDSYGKSYQKGGSQNPNNRPQDITLSATDLRGLDSTLVPAINRFSEAMTAALPTDKAVLAKARLSTQSFYNSDCADLGDFVKRVLASNASAAVKDAAMDVQQALAATITFETHAGTAANASGLVVYFPKPGTSYNPKYDDKNAIAFADESWKGFLKAFVKQ